MRSQIGDVTAQPPKRPWRDMKYAASLVALFYIVVGIVGLVSRDTMMMLRQHYLATTIGLYAGGGARLLMGLVLILSASASRAPKTLRVLGAVLCVQGLAAMFSTVELARSVLDAEARHLSLFPIGALVALASGGFVAFAVLAGPRPVA